jgi:hypothetical protein
MRRIPLAAAVGVTLSMLCSCMPGPHRNTLTREQLRTAQAEFEADSLAVSQHIMKTILRRMELEVDEKAADPSLPEPTIDLLSISGGGDYGSFGASFLEAWGRVPQDNPMHRPHFDVIGGISTGALIAPFAFEASDESLQTAAKTYTEARPSWVCFRGLLSLLPDNASCFDMSKLEKVIRQKLSPDLVKYVASQNDRHRVLLVGSTDLDLARLRMWNLTSEAKRAVEEGSYGRFQDILLSSAAIPIAFPARAIDGKVYADGGVVGNVLMGRDPQWVVKLAETWKSRRPGVPMPKVRMWVLVNNKARLDPQFVNANWMPVAGRSVAAAIHSSTVSALQQMWLRYRLAAVQTGEQTEFRWCAIPDDFDVAVTDHMFDPKVTGPLAELGARMGAEPEMSWKSDPPKGD